MNGFYQRPYNQEELNRLQDERNAANIMGMMAPQNMPQSIPGAQSLDDIVNQNAKEMRRQSMPLGFPHTHADLDSTMRRVSMLDMHQMMEFGDSSPTGPLNGYQFDPSTTTNIDRMVVDSQPADNQDSQSRRPSNADLSIDTQFQSQAPYGNNDPSGTVYPSPMAISSALDVDLNSPYNTSTMPSALSMNMDMHMMGSDMQTSDLFAHQQYHGSPLMQSPVQQNTYGSMLGPSHDPGGGGMSTKDTFSPSKDDMSSPGLLHSSSRTTSGEDTTHSNQRRGSSSAQPSNMPHSNPPHTSPKRASRNTGPPETINGMTLPWPTPPGKSGKL
jgi:hypothetical protein